MMVFLGLFLLLAFVVFFSQESTPSKTVPVKPAPVQGPRKPVGTVPCVKLEYTDEHRAAVHEVGHLCAVWSCTWVGDVSEVRIESNNRAGVVLYDFRTLKWGGHEAWCALVIMLSGVAAEMHVYGKSRSLPAEKDLRKARWCAREIAKGPLDPPWKDLRQGPGRKLPFEKMFADPLCEQEALVLQAGYAMARDLVDRHDGKFDDLVALLAGRRSLGMKDVEAVLGSRAWVKLAAPFGASFVLPKSSKSSRTKSEGVSQ